MLFAFRGLPHNAKNLDSVGTNMRMAQELTIRQMHGTKDGEPPQSEIFIHENPTGKFVQGLVLEAAVFWENRYLLLTTDDCPFEEMLGIRLLDAGFNLLDSARIGGIYSTGSFDSLELIEPNRLRFLFIGDTWWDIELLPHRRFRLPWVSEPSGVWRSFSFSRHFIVRGNPQPETGRSRLT